MVDFPQGNCWVWKSTVKANQDLCRENWVIQFLRLKSKKTSWSSSKHHPPTKVFNLPSCKLTVGRWKHSSSNPFVNGRVELGKNYSSDLLGVWARMVFQEIMFCWVVLGDMTTKHIFAIVDGKQSLQIMLWHHEPTKPLNWWFTQGKNPKKMRIVLICELF